MLSDGAGTFGRGSGVAKLPDAGKRQARVYAESAKNLLISGKDIAESGELAGGGFRERHAAGAATGAVTKRSRLQYKNRLPGSKPAQPRRRGKAREAAANNGEIHTIGESARGRTEINGPGRRAPRLSFANRVRLPSFANGEVSTGVAAHGISLMQRECGACREFPRLPQTYFCRPAVQPIFRGANPSRRTTDLARMAALTSGDGVRL